MIDQLKKKKDGTIAYKAECQGARRNPPEGSYGFCDGEVERVRRKATSFGQTFTTHAYMCSAHALKFGYSK